MGPISWIGRDVIRQRNHYNLLEEVQYIPRNMHTVSALLCFVVVIHWLIFPYPSGLLHWHCGNLTIAPVPVKQPWWIWINTSCEFIINDCITTTKQSTTKPCACFLGYTVLGTYLFLASRKNYATGPSLNIRNDVLLKDPRKPRSCEICIQNCTSALKVDRHLGNSAADGLSNFKAMW